MRWRIGEQMPSSGYQVVRDNDYWPGHTARSLVTAGIIAWLKPESLMDPACGDATIVSRAAKLMALQPRTYLNDVSEPMVHHLQEHLDLDPERTVLDCMDAGRFMTKIGEVDLIVLTEFLEHLHDPEAILRMAREHGHRLVASSPLSESVRGNHEHVWGWDREGYEQMLVATGWRPTSYQELHFADPSLGYSYQIWTAA